MVIAEAPLSQQEIRHVVRSAVSLNHLGDGQGRLPTTPAKRREHLALCLK